MVYKPDLNMQRRSSMLQLYMRIVCFVAAIFAFVSVVYGNGSVHAESRKKMIYKKEDQLKSPRMLAPRPGRQDVPFDPDYGKNPAGRYDGGSEPDPI